MDLETVRLQMQQNLNRWTHDCVSNCPCLSRIRSGDMPSCHLVSYVANLDYGQLPDSLVKLMFEDRPFPKDTGLCSSCQLTIDGLWRCNGCRFTCIDRWFNDPVTGISLCRFCLPTETITQIVRIGGTNPHLWNQSEGSQFGVDLLRSAEAPDRQRHQLYQQLRPLALETVRRREMFEYDTYMQNRALLEKHFPNLDKDSIGLLIEAANGHQDLLTGNNLFEVMQSVTGLGNRIFSQDRGWGAGSP